MVRWTWEDPEGVSDTAAFVLHDDGSLFIELDSPWQGDTESGFGAKMSMRIPAPEANELIGKLFAALNGEKP